MPDGADLAGGVKHHLAFGDHEDVGVGERGGRRIKAPRTQNQRQS